MRYRATTGKDTQIKGTIIVASMLYSNAIGSKWGDTLPDTGFGLYSWWKGPTAWKGKAVCPELDLCACDQARMLERGAVSFLLPFWLVSWGLQLTEFQRLTQ